MICPSCGTDNMPERKYCGLCGHSLKPTASTTQPPARPNPQPPAYPQSSAYQQTPAQPYIQSTSSTTAALPDPPPKPVSGGLAAKPAPVPVASEEAAPPPEHSFFADAFRYALAWRPLSLLTIGFFASTMIYFFSTIISAVILGAMRRGTSSPDAVGTIDLILTILTLLVMYVVEIVFLSATTKICYERVVNGRAVARVEAMKFAVSNGGTVIIAPFLFVLVFAGVFFVEWLIFLLSKVETVGPVITGIFFAPFVVVNALLFFVVNYAIWMTLISVSSGTTTIGETVSKTVNLVKQSFRTRIPEILSLTLVQVLISIFAIVIVAIGFVITTMVVQGGEASIAINAIFDGRIAQLLDRLIMGSPVPSNLRIGPEPPVFGPLVGLLTLAGGIALILGILLAFPRVFFANGCIRIYQRLVKEPQLSVRE
jgi:hypothetical protein